MKFGGCPSPIWPDGRLTSLPIPHNWPTVTPAYGAPYNTTYGDVRIYGGNCSAGDALALLGRGHHWRQRLAHLDPDLWDGALVNSATGQANRPGGWQPLFGQVKAAQGHLRKQKVGRGDLFLFFGLFQKTEIKGDDASFRFVGDPLHVIFGYLRIGDIWPSAPPPQGWPGGLPGNMRNHPHALTNYGPSNTIYAAAPSENRANHWQAGAFTHFHQDLLLTAPGCSHHIWQLPAWMHPFDPPSPPRRFLTYHEKQRSRWQLHGGHVLLASAYPGQEFVLHCDDYPPARRPDPAEHPLAS